MTAFTAMRQAVKKKTIIPAFNIPYIPMVAPVVAAIRDENSVAMIQVARLEWVKFQSRSLEAVADEFFKHHSPPHTLLHLDHVPAVDEDGLCVDYMPIIRRALAAGFQSVMVDASRLSLEENIAATRRVADAAHEAGVAVEAELGAVVGHESTGLGMSYDELFRSKKGFTVPAEARRFAAESGCDWLSIAAGSIHGAIAENTRKQAKPQARLDLDHIAALFDATEHMPLVLHGGTGIEQPYILGAIQNGVAKINVATDIRQPYEAAMDSRPGDVEHAREQVYNRTRSVLRDFLRVANSRDLLFGSE
jgi:ketose-bisphosphate aldolase